MMRITNKGYTLIELVIVIAILAIIAGIAILFISGYIENAKKAVVMTNAKTLVGQLNLCLEVGETTVGSNRYWIERWVKTGVEEDVEMGSIIYIGPTDNSVTIEDSGSHHDYAKKALRSMLGDRAIDFGYRLYFTVSDDESVQFERIEVFYKKPKNAAILVAKPDFIIP